MSHRLVNRVRSSTENLAEEGMDVKLGFITLGVAGEQTHNQRVGE